MLTTATTLRQPYRLTSETRSDARCRTIAAGLTIAARILLGLVFVFAGTMKLFLMHTPPPAAPGLVGAFMDVFFRSHWVAFIAAFEFLAGALLVVNRYVPLALIVLAGIITNILIVHLTMAPAGLPPPIVLTGLWVAVAWPLRARFAPLLAAKA